MAMKIDDISNIKDIEDIERLMVKLDCNEILFSIKNKQKFFKIFKAADINLDVLTVYNSMMVKDSYYVSMRNIPSGIIVVMNDLKDFDCSSMSTEDMNNKIKLEII